MFVWKIVNVLKIVKRFFISVRTVSRRRAKLRRRSSPSHFNIKSMEQRRLAKQLDLAKTLTVTVLVFVFCLTPYGICILLDQNYINPLAKRVSLQNFS